MLQVSSMGGNEDIDGDGIPDNVGGSLAVLQGDRLLVDGATMTIHANGGAIFNSYDHINGSKVIIEGETHFNGKDENSYFWPQRHHVSWRRLQPVLPSR